RELADAARNQPGLPSADRSARRYRALRRRSRRWRIERVDRRAWTGARTKESCVSEIVDGHHHIWRQADLPWLVGPMQPRIFGPYEPIRRDYAIEDYLSDISGAGVVKSVYVQTNWPKEGFEDEARWVQQTADRAGWPHA